MRTRYLVMSLTITAAAAISCKQRQYEEGSQVRATKDILTVDSDATGTFVIQCKDGCVQKASADAIKKDEVCKPVQTCKNIEFENGDSTYFSTLDMDSIGATDFQVYWETIPMSHHEFRGKITPWAKVSGGVLTNSSQGGSLTYGSDPYNQNPASDVTVHFAAETKNAMSWAMAQKFCQKQGFRLPSAQELLDFCASGTPQNTSSNPKLFQKQRCGDKHVWSGTFMNKAQPYIWYWESNGSLWYKDAASTDGLATVRCITNK